MRFWFFPPGHLTTRHGARSKRQPGGAAAPLSALAQQAHNACPGLMSRTESAVANGYIQYYYLSDCERMARAIDFNTGNESTATYDGPKLPDSDA